MRSRPEGSGRRGTIAGEAPRYTPRVDLLRAPLMSNLELKARLEDLDAAAEACVRLGAQDQGEEVQTDTYFSLGRYRLKLRESSTGNHLLIGYSRADSHEARRSQYRIAPVVAPRSVRSTLERQWGVKAVVRKTRRLFLWEGRVRIHLDRVDQIGTFLEFEALLDGADPAYDQDAAHLDLARLSHDFGIDDRDLVDTSYSTLVRAAAETPAGT